MRVYEVAKQCGCSSKDIIDFLKEHGFAVSSHMAVLDDKGLELVLEKFTSSKSANVAKPVEAPLLPEKPLEKKEAPQVAPKKEVRSEAASKNESKTIYREPILLGELAEKIGINASELIIYLLKKGQVFNKNQKLPEPVLLDLSRAFEFEVQERQASKKEVQHGAVSTQNLVSRAPVVVIIGHVDHGKTTLLDYIRKSRVAEKEKGGITQHLGAYEVKTSHGKLIFLDTPGHEAFTLIRKRGLGVADVAILVVAADDGIMPQTIEAIQQAKSAGVLTVVAINKMDKVDPVRIDVVKKMLSSYDLVPEEWGGQTVMMPISAKLGSNVDTLLELVALQAELMELKVDPLIPAEGFVLESQVQKGFGSTATFLARQGRLKVGDYFVAGDSFGKVVSITDSHGAKLKEVGPTVPVKISGFENFPKAGDYLRVVSQEEYKNFKSDKEKNRIINAPLSSEAKIKLLVKADTESSREAIVEAITKLSKSKNYDTALVASAVGDLTENDVMLAANTGAYVYCFNVKQDANAAVAAKEHGVSVREFNIIYKLLENIEVLAESFNEEQVKLVKTGEAVVKKVFEIKKVGVVAGFGVKQGKIYKHGEIEIWRNGKKVGHGTIKSLQKDKKTVKEVGVGFEGALLVDGFDAWMEDDRVVCLVDAQLL